jgi:serine protease Do
MNQNRASIFTRFFSIFTTIVAVVAVAALLFSGGRQTAYALSADSGLVGSNVIVDIAKTKNPAVVNVTIKGKHKKASRNNPQMPEFGPFRDFFNNMPEMQEPHPKSGTGSGFLIDAQGHILSNHHVVEGAQEIIVTLQEGDEDKEYPARLVGSDAKLDISLLKIEREAKNDRPFPYLSFGDSDALQVGEWVIAIGSPFGLNHTVTAGIVSAKGRNIGAGPYDEFIQTDASINPGNSGGPLLNVKGEVVGINTAILSGNTGGNVGIGFAIPGNSAKTILKDLKEKGSVTRGWLGVMIQRITPELAGTLGLEQTRGALVGDVTPNGPAAKAGIRRGDVVMKFGKIAIHKMEELPKLVAATPPGVGVDLEVLRDGKTKNVPITVGTLESPTEGRHAALGNVITLGIQVQDLTPELAKSMKLPEADGVLVSGVDPSGSAAQGGIKRGDVIVEVNRNPVRNASEFQQAVGRDKSEPLLFLIRRGNNTLFVAVKPS